MEFAAAIAVGVAGLLAGFINGVVGGASLLTFPVLVATGLAPVSAAVTNTVGIGAANIFALIPHRHSMRWAFTAWRRGAMWTAVGAAVGAFHRAPAALLGRYLRCAWREIRGNAPE